MKQLFTTFPTTISFIFLSFFISIITWFGSIDTTLLWFDFDTNLIFEGQVWRLITPIFLHFPAMGIIFAHLVFNMMWLYQFGSDIERYHSSWHLAFLIIFSGVVSNICQSFMSTGIFGGMSGVVYCLLGYLFFVPKLSRRYPVCVDDAIAYFLIGFMVLASTGLLGKGIANTAHYAGFFCGAGAAVFRAKIFP